MKVAKLRILSIFLTISSVPNSGFSQGSDFNNMSHLKLPDVSEVVKEFYGNYSIKSLPASSEITIEKKRRGWYVAQQDIVDNEAKIVSSDLFWSLAKKKYLGLKFEKLKKEDRDSSIASKFPLPYNKRYYRICPYYGYRGWDWDVMQDYGKVESLPDSMLLALGRAYSSYASNLLNNNTGYADRSVQFKLADGKNSMSEEQLDTYRYYSQKAIVEFEKLAAMDSLYECLVGPIKYKLANDYLTSFLFIGIYQNWEEARKELRAGLYDKGMISVAKNYLNSCAKGAILFTNGDNDTFPLLYAQSFLGIRRDVLVVNLSLLNTHRYINDLRSGSNPLDLSFDQEAYKGQLRAYLPMYLNDSIGTMDLGDALDFIQSDSQDKKIETAMGNYLNYLPVKKYSFKVNKEMVLANGSISSDLQDKILDSIELRFSGSYIFRNKMIVLDIVHENDWERPIYYAASVERSAYTWIDEYLQLEGLAYRIVPLKRRSYGGQTGAPDTEIMYENMMNKFEWAGMENNTTLKRMGYNFQYNFARLADELIREGKKDSAIAVLDKCVAVFPDELIPYSFFMIAIMENYYKVDLPDKANSIVRILVDRCRKELTDTFDGKGGDKRNTQNCMSTILRLKDLVTTYKQSEFIEELTKLNDDLNLRYQVWQRKTSPD